MITQSDPMNGQTSIIKDADVVANESLCREHFRLTLRIAGFPQAYPGQFVHIIPSNAANAAAAIETQGDSARSFPTAPTLEVGLTVRRAFSIAGLTITPEGQADVEIIYRVVGRGTRWMAQLTGGDQVNLLGPLGNVFTIEKPKKLALLVAGGVGLPPMIWWAERLRKLNITTIAFVGAQSHDLFALHLEFDATLPTSGSEPAFAAREFTQHGVEMVLSTDDGSLGVAGYVTDALTAYLDAHSPNPADVAVYTCGPEPMMKSVVQLCAGRDIDCQLCMERSMACGMGTCQSCVVPVHDDAAEDGWRYKLCCTDGPIFDCREVIWT